MEANRNDGRDSSPRLERTPYNRRSNITILQGQGPMPKIKFVNEKQEIEVPAGANLREEALKNGVQVYRGVERFVHCMGHGMCGACKVMVKSGMDNLSPRTMLEKVALFRMLSSIG